VAAYVKAHPRPHCVQVRMSKDLRIAYVRYSVLFGKRKVFEKRLERWYVRPHTQPTLPPTRIAVLASDNRTVAQG
jgi:hypothetical protein